MCSLKRDNAVRLNICFLRSRKVLYFCNWHQCCTSVHNFCHCPHLTVHYHINLKVSFLARLFRRKSWAIVIARSSSLSSCKNFNVAHYSKSTEGINIKLGILAHHDNVQLQDKWHNSESCSVGVLPLFHLKFLSRMMAPDRRVLVPLIHRIRR